MCHGRLVGRITYWLGCRFWRWCHTCGMYHLHMLWPKTRNMLGCACFCSERSYSTSVLRPSSRRILATSDFALRWTWQVPVVDGYSFPHLTKRLNIAGRHITSYLIDLLLRRGCVQFPLIIMSKRVCTYLERA